MRHVVMRARDVVFFKGLVEASEGLAAVFAEHGGDLAVAAPVERGEELDAFLDELVKELGAVKIDEPAGPGGSHPTEDGAKIAG